MENILQKAIVSLSDLSGNEDYSLFRSVMDLMNDGALLVDNDERIVYVNLKFCELTGYQSDELVGQIATDLLLMKDMEETMQQKVKEREMLIAENYEIPIKRKDGSMLWVRVSASPIIDADQNVVGSIGMHQDITEKRKQELQLQKALKDKELFLKETHHRVKNNLQIITSLMNLQATEIESKDDAISAFNTCKNRINAMSALHEIVYKCKDLASINFGNYCNKLVDQLTAATGVEDRKITVKTDINVRKMGVDNSLTCGMLINEIMTNCIEHAFDEKGGEIDLKMVERNNSITLSIKDNGCGLPMEVSTEAATTLGLQLIHSFTDQLNGHVEVTRKQGTTIDVVFPR